MPAILNQAISANSFDEFERWGETIRLMGTVLNWRLAQTQSTESMLLGNVTGPYSRGEVWSLLANYIQNSLSYNGDWTLELIKAFDQIKEHIARFRTLSASLPATRSALLVDDTMRRLTGYIVARKIPLKPA
jgi:hypothetical protein